MDDALVIVSKVYRIYANVPGHAYELGEDEGSIVAALPPELGRSAAMVLDAVRTRFGAAWAYYSTGDVTAQELVTAAQLVLQNSQEEKTKMSKVKEDKKSKRFSFPIFKRNTEKATQHNFEKATQNCELKASDDASLRHSVQIAAEVDIKRQPALETQDISPKLLKETSNVTADELLAAAETVISRATFSPFQQPSPLRSESPLIHSSAGHMTSSEMTDAPIDCNTDHILYETERMLERALDSEQSFPATADATDGSDVSAGELLTATERLLATFRFSGSTPPTVNADFVNERQFFYEDHLDAFSNDETDLCDVTQFVTEQERKNVEKLLETVQIERENISGGPPVGILGGGQSNEEVTAGTKGIRTSDYYTDTSDVLKKLQEEIKLHWLEEQTHFISIEGTDIVDEHDEKVPNSQLIAAVRLSQPTTAVAYFYCNINSLHRIEEGKVEVIPTFPENVQILANLYEKSDFLCFAIIHLTAYFVFLKTMPALELFEVQKRVSKLRKYELRPTAAPKAKMSSGGLKVRCVVHDCRSEVTPHTFENEIIETPATEHCFAQTATIDDITQIATLVETKVLFAGRRPSCKVQSATKSVLSDDNPPVNIDKKVVRGYLHRYMDELGLRKKLQPRSSDDDDYDDVELQAWRVTPRRYTSDDSSLCRVMAASSEKLRRRRSAPLTLFEDFLLHPTGLDVPPCDELKYESLKDNGFGPNIPAPPPLPPISAIQPTEQPIVTETDSCIDSRSSNETCSSTNGKDDIYHAIETMATTPTSQWTKKKRSRSKSQKRRKKIQANRTALEQDLTLTGASQDELQLESDRTKKEKSFAISVNQGVKAVNNELRECEASSDSSATFKPFDSDVRTEKVRTVTATKDEEKRRSVEDIYRTLAAVDNSVCNVQDKMAARGVLIGALEKVMEGEKAQVEGQNEKTKPESELNIPQLITTESTIISEDNIEVEYNSNLNVLSDEDNSKIDDLLDLTAVVSPGVSIAEEMIASGYAEGRKESSTVAVSASSSLCPVLRPKPAQSIPRPTSLPTSHVSPCVVTGLRKFPSFDQLDKTTLEGSKELGVVNDFNLTSQEDTDRFESFVIISHSNEDLPPASPPVYQARPEDVEVPKTTSYSERFQLFQTVVDIDIGENGSENVLKEKKEEDEGVAKKLVLDTLDAFEILEKENEEEITGDNDCTFELIRKSDVVSEEELLSQLQSGADAMAPSDSLDNILSGIVNTCDDAMSSKPKETQPVPKLTTGNITEGASFIDGRIALKQKPKKTSALSIKLNSRIEQLEADINSIVKLRDQEVESSFHTLSMDKINRKTNDETVKLSSQSDSQKTETRVSRSRWSPIKSTSDADVAKALASLKQSTKSLSTRRRCVSPLSIFFTSPLLNRPLEGQRRHSWATLPLQPLTIQAEFSLDDTVPIKSVVKKRDKVLRQPRSKSLPKSPKTVRFSPKVEHRCYQLAGESPSPDYVTSSVEDSMKSEAFEKTFVPIQNDADIEERCALPLLQRHNAELIITSAVASVPVSTCEAETTCGGKTDIATTSDGILPGRNDGRSTKHATADSGIRSAVECHTTFDQLERNASYTTATRPAIYLGNEKRHLTVECDRVPALQLAPPIEAKMQRPDPLQIPSHVSLPCSSKQHPVETPPIPPRPCLTERLSPPRLSDKEPVFAAPSDPSFKTPRQSSEESTDNTPQVSIKPAMPIVRNGQTPLLPPPPRNSRSRGVAARRANVFPRHFGTTDRSVAMPTSEDSLRQASPVQQSPNNFSFVRSSCDDLCPIVQSNLSTECDSERDRQLEKEPLLGDCDSTSSIASDEGLECWETMSHGAQNVAQFLAERALLTSSAESLVSEVSPEDIRETFSLLAQGPAPLQPRQAMVMTSLLSSTDQELLTRVLQQIANAAAFTSNQDLFREAETLPRLSRLLRVHSMALHAGHVTFPAVVNGAASAISNLAVNEQNQSQLQECIPTLIDFAVSEQSPETVQLAALQALTNLSVTSHNHMPYTKVIQTLYEYLDTRNTGIQMQALKVLVNLSINPDMVPHLLAAKSPGCLLDLLVTKLCGDDVTLRWTTFLANVMATARDRQIDVSLLPTEYKAASPETMYTALYGLSHGVNLRSRVFVLSKHSNHDIRYQAARIYGCLV